VILEVAPYLFATSKEYGLHAQPRGRAGSDCVPWVCAHGHVFLIMFRWYAPTAP